VVVLGDIRVVTARLTEPIPFLLDIVPNLDACEHGSCGGLINPSITMAIRETGDPVAKEAVFPGKDTAQNLTVKVQCLTLIEVERHFREQITYLFFLFSGLSHDAFVEKEAIYNIEYIIRQLE
jgi:hypothetical protein